MLAGIHPEKKKRRMSAGSLQGSGEGEMPVSFACQVNSRRIGEKPGLGTINSSSHEKDAEEWCGGQVGLRWKMEAQSLSTFCLYPATRLQLAQADWLPPHPIEWPDLGCKGMF